MKSTVTGVMVLLVLLMYLPGRAQAQSHGGHSGGGGGHSRGGSHGSGGTVQHGNQGYSGPAHSGGTQTYGGGRASGGSGSAGLHRNPAPHAHPYSANYSSNQPSGGRAGGPAAGGNVSAGGPHHNPVPGAHSHTMNYSTNQHFGSKEKWEHAWYRQWYHKHPTWWNNGWYWWDPTVSQYVPYEAGVVLPEEQYVEQAMSGVVPVAAAPAIRIVNPAGTQVTLGYSLNNDAFDIQPGEIQDLAQDRTWVIEFDRGGDFGTARYTLEPGQYTFAETDHGWELYHQADLGAAPSDS